MQLLRWAIVPYVLAVSLSLAGCSGSSINPDDPADLYKDAQAEIEAEHYQIALDKLRVIKNKFPYSKYSVDAELRIADVLMLQETYLEAAQSYETFRDLHPKHERADYAIFRAGKAYYLDTPDLVARDMTSGHKALETLSEYLSRYPNSKDAPEAKKLSDDIRNRIASKELYVADFYEKRESPDSARGRYQKIVEQYPGTESAKQAKEKLAKLPAPAPRKSDESPTTGAAE